ncbi:MAG TPA: NUDIX hydrolase [Holophagaceae bacterium]|nr:NUDIX hydrolase [Holophagaceae bacterium]
MAWRLTVAAVIERQGRYLVVEEAPDGGPRVLNQPAGHVEPGEGLLEAAIREVREETGLAFTPEALLGLYALQAENGKDYLRVCFTGAVAEGEAAPQDADILACHWLSYEELAARPLRSPLVRQCVEDHRAGRRLPLEAVGAVVRAR